MMDKKNGLFFLMGWLGMVLYFTQRWIFGPVIPPLMREFGVDKTAIGVIGSASLWGYMFTPIIAGIISDRYGRKLAVLAGIFAFSGLTLLCGLAKSTNQLFMGRFFTGIGEAFFFVPLLAFTLELFPKRPGFYLTLMSSGSSLGWFTGPAMAGWLVNLTGGWRSPFFVAGIAGLIITLFMYLLWPEDQGGLVQSRPLLDKNLFIPTNLVMLALLSLAAAFQIATEFGFTMWYPAFLELERSAIVATAGVIAGLYGLGQFIGRPIMGWVSDKLGYRSVGFAGAAVLCLSLILILSVSSMGWRGYFTFQAGFIGAAVMGALWTFTGLVFPSFKGLALGIMATVGYASASIAPIVIGYLGDHHSVEMGLWLVCVPGSMLTGLVILATFIVKPKGEG
ncbi:MAG: MFS transporter [Deltaproteobacteria bacterium]|nr:MFS transporter [Deltaproteobacteria bacterium]